MTQDEILFGAFFVEMQDPKPPSVNAMYSDGATRRFLTREGASFKDALKEAVVRAIQEQSIDWKSVVDEVYLHRGWVRLEIYIYVEKLYNESWKPGGRTKPSKKFPKGNPQSPYQKMDAGSYDKIIQDAVVLGTGIDDSIHLSYEVTKLEDKENPRISVHYKVYCGDRTDHANG